MLNEQGIGGAMRRANPAPDPERAVSDVEANDLFAAILQGRDSMVHTQDKTTKRAEQAVRERTPWSRRRIALVAAVVFALIAVPAVALFVDLDAPPLDGEFPEGSVQSGTYGAAEGVEENCASHMDFDPNGVPVMAGMCGVLRLEGGEWNVVNTEVGSYVDIAVAPDGTVWLADVDGPIRSFVKGDVTHHPFTARAVEVTTDGTVWAIEYSMDLPVLMSFDGSTFISHDVEPPEELIAAPDGSLHVLALVPIGYDPETQAADSWYSMLGRIVDGVYTSKPAPEGFGDRVTLAPDGALWSIGGTGRMIERSNGVLDTEWALVR
ncbi:MAG: hypothetical protein ABFR53_12325, partial [Actinomycetota bacterium]